MLWVAPVGAQRRDSSTGLGLTPLKGGRGPSHPLATLFPPGADPCLPWPHWGEQDREHAGSPGVLACRAAPHPAGSEWGLGSAPCPPCALDRGFPPFGDPRVGVWCRAGRRAGTGGGEVTSGQQQAAAGSSTGRPSARSRAPGAHFPTTGAVISGEYSEQSQGGPPALPLHLPHRSPAPAHVNAAAKVSEQSPDKELFLGAGARSEDTVRPLTMGGRGPGFPRDHSAAEGPVRFPR